MATVLPLHAPRSSAAIRDEIAQLEIEHRRAVEKAAALQGKRNFSLVNAKDKDLDALEEGIRAEERNRDRAAARVATLRLELQAAQERERAVAEDEAIARCQRVRARAVQLLQDEYPKLANRLAALLAEVTAAGEYIKRHTPESTTLLDPEEVRREPVRVIKGRGEYLAPAGVSIIAERRSVSYTERMMANTTQEAPAVKCFEPDTTVGGELPPPLAENVALPAFGYRELAIWTPQESVYDARARYLEILKGAGVI